MSSATRTKKRKRTPSFLFLHRFSLEVKQKRNTKSLTRIRCRMSVAGDRRFGHDVVVFYVFFSIWNRRTHVFIIRSHLMSKKEKREMKSKILRMSRLQEWSDALFQEPKRSDRDNLGANRWKWIWLWDSFSKSKRSIERIWWGDCSARSLPFRNQNSTDASWWRNRRSHRFVVQSFRRRQISHEWYPPMCIQ